LKGLNKYIQDILALLHKRKPLNNIILRETYKKLSLYIKEFSVTYSFKKKEEKA